MTSLRGTSYSSQEDVLLCNIFVDISQDPIVGAYQTGAAFWSRVENKYDNTLPNTIRETRNVKSLRDRFAIIKSTISKLNGCVAQIELRNPSGASNEDIMNEAKILLLQDSKYKKGFKFDHVRHKMKDVVNLGNNYRQRVSNNTTSSQSDASMPNSPVFSSPGISQFNINLSDENDGGSSSRMRPEGVKKAKLKRKKGEDLFRIAKSHEDANKKIGEEMAISNVLQQKAIEESGKRRMVKEHDRNERIMAITWQTIDDPIRREWYRNEQLKIAQQSSHQSQPENSSNTFGQYFGNIGGSGSGLPEY